MPGSVPGRRHGHSHGRTRAASTGRIHATRRPSIHAVHDLEPIRRGAAVGGLALLGLWPCPTWRPARRRRRRRRSAAPCRSNRTRSREPAVPMADSRHGPRTAGPWVPVPMWLTHVRRANRPPSTGVQSSRHTRRLAEDRARAFPPAGHEADDRIGRRTEHRRLGERRGPSATPAAARRRRVASMRILLSRRRAGGTPVDMLRRRTGRQAPPSQLEPRVLEGLAVPRATDTWGRRAASAVSRRRRARSRARCARSASRTPTARPRPRTRTLASRFRVVHVGGGSRISPLAPRWPPPRPDAAIRARSSRPASWLRLVPTGHARHQEPRVVAPNLDRRRDPVREGHHRVERDAETVRGSERDQRLALRLCGSHGGHGDGIHGHAVARRQQHAGLFEQLADCRHSVAHLVVTTQVRAAAHGLEPVDDRGVGHACRRHPLVLRGTRTHRP